MTRPIRFLPEAKEEFDAAADWYGGKRISLGLDFIFRIGSILAIIAENPEKHGKVFEEARKVVVSGFPYIILYQIKQDEVIILAVFHSSRDPSIWQERL